jgi:hypothetical protein
LHTKHPSELDHAIVAVTHIAGSIPAIRAPCAACPGQVAYHHLPAKPLLSLHYLCATAALQINCGSIAPITASQFGTNRFMERTLMQRAGGKQLSSVDRFGCAAVAGAVSALVASPTELIIIQQQVSYQCDVHTNNTHK